MAPETLTVVLNRSGLNGAEAPPTFATNDSFTLVLENRGEAIHVHLRFRDRLAEVASVDESNHYVDAGETHRVHVDTSNDSETVSGELDVITGHGADGTGVELTLEPRERPKSVDVDESLSQPRASVTDDDSSTRSEPVVRADMAAGTIPDSLTLVVTGFAFLALLIAAVAAVALGSVVVTLGLLAVVLAVGSALYILWD